MTSFKSLFGPAGTFEFLFPYIIAEIGVNHENSMEKAKKMIEEVADSGGHAAKFQTYKADKIASPEHAPSYWDRKAEPCASQHLLFQKYDKFGINEYRELAAHCEKVGVDFLSTPFDIDAVGELAPFMKFFKVASADVTNVPLLRAIAKHGKPVLMSTGAATLAEVETAIRILKENGAPDVALMHCILNYPTPKENAQMSLMRDLIRIFGEDCQIGYSDHVKPNDDGSMPSLEMATLHGAVVLEKHYTYDKTLPGNDHYHAMDKDDLAKFVDKLKDYKMLYGAGPRNMALESQAIQNARRRILVEVGVKKGEKLTEKNLIALRSNKGIEISRWDEVVGRVASKDMDKGAPVCWGDFSEAV
ncbi:MAG: N-acetylneuraminate synthase family protein [Alphaproteobacteria bacterium]|nr:N-acetylneuraminate synthase family protein [Alphaproteobacteria bacterium]